MTPAPPPPPSAPRNPPTPPSKQPSTSTALPRAIPISSSTSSHLPPPLKQPPSGAAAATAPAPKPRIDYDAILRSPAHQRFRAKYLAVGVAIIAGAGALFGAQLKTVWQDWRANEERKVTRAASSVAHGKDKDNANASNDREGRSPGGGQGKAKNAVTETITISDLNRSIASLDTVRGQLMRKKQQEEQRLVNLLGRMERKRDLEEKRAEAAAKAAATTQVMQGTETVQAAARAAPVGAGQTDGR